MPINRDLPAGVSSLGNDRAPGVKKPSGLNVARFIAREEELHQARKYTQSHETNTSRALWEEKQNRQTGSGARIQQNKRYLNSFFFVFVGLTFCLINVLFCCAPQT